MLAYRKYSNLESDSVEEKVMTETGIYECKPHLYDIYLKKHCLQVLFFNSTISNLTMRTDLMSIVLYKSQITDHQKFFIALN